MRLSTVLRFSVLLGTTACLYAQQPVGSVSTTEAAVTNAGGGILTASGGRAVMFGSSTVTAARDHNAAVALNRGGDLLVCQTTNLHLSAAADDSLMLGLDRGAIEIRMRSKSGDVLITPDLRFTMDQTGPLDLQLRVTPVGDTCVDNRGLSAPTLKITSAFGDASYELKPGQHVLFEHGNLREVVDHETTSCGCPPDALNPVLPSDPNAPMTAAQSAAAHPFPAAVSEGLAQPSALPPDQPGQTHVQVATTLGYDPATPHPAGENADVPEPRAQAPASVVPVADTKQGGGFFHSIGHLFKRLFVR